MAYTEEVKNKIKASQDCRNRLAYELHADPLTIRRKLAKDHIDMESSHAQKIISEEIGVPVELLREKI